MELKILDNNTLELGAFVITQSISPDTRGEVARDMIQTAILVSRAQNRVLISLTNNPRLQRLYYDM